MKEIIEDIVSNAAARQPERESSSLVQFIINSRQKAPAPAPGFALKAYKSFIAQIVHNNCIARLTSTVLYLPFIKWVALKTVS